MTTWIVYLYNQSGIQSNTVGALMREVTNFKARLLVPGAGYTEYFTCTGVGKQGALETPDVFNIMKPVVQSWNACKLRLELDEGKLLLNHFICADNIWLLAGNIHQLRVMTWDNIPTPWLLVKT